MIHGKLCFGILILDGDNSAQRTSVWICTILSLYSMHICRALHFVTGDKVFLSGLSPPGSRYVRVFEVSPPVEKSCSVLLSVPVLKPPCEMFQILEFFGTGTAAVVSPVSSILYEGDDIMLPTMKQTSPLYSRLFSAITDIQYGRVTHPWTRVVDERPHLYESQNYKYSN